MTEATIETGLPQAEALRRTVEKLLVLYNRVRVEIGIEVLDVTSPDQVPVALPDGAEVHCYTAAEDWRADALDRTRAVLRSGPGHTAPDLVLPEHDKCFGNGGTAVTPIDRHLLDWVDGPPPEESVAERQVREAREGFRFPADFPAVQAVAQGLITESEARAAEALRVLKEAEPKVVVVSDTITSARITALPKKMFDPMPEVWVRFGEGGPEEKLFDYFPDEISFSPEEFVGLTRQQAAQLKYQKDLAYLKR